MKRHKRLQTIHPETLITGTIIGLVHPLQEPIPRPNRLTPSYRICNPTPQPPPHPAPPHPPQTAHRKTAHQCLHPKQPDGALPVGVVGEETGEIKPTGNRPSTADTRSIVAADPVPGMRATHSRQTRHLSSSATAAPSAEAPPAPPPAPQSAAPAPPTPPTPQHDRQQPFSPCDTSRPLLSVSLLRLRPKLRQLHPLLLSQRPPLRQLLQHRNTIGSNLFRPGTAPRLFPSVSETGAPSAEAPPAPPPAPQSAAPAPSTPPTPQNDRQQPFPTGNALRPLPFLSETGAPSAEAPPAPPPAPQSAAPCSANASNTATRSAAAFSPGIDPRPFPSFCFCCAFGRSSASSASCPQSAAPAPPTPPTPQHGGSNLSSPVPLRIPFLLFLLLLRHLRLEFRQLRLLLLSQRPLLRQLLQLHNTGGNSLSCPVPLRVPFLPFPALPALGSCCAVRSVGVSTCPPPSPGLPETAPSSSCVHRPPLNPPEPGPASSSSSPRSRRLSPPPARTHCADVLGPSPRRAARTPVPAAQPGTTG